MCVCVREREGGGRWGGGVGGWVCVGVRVSVCGGVDVRVGRWGGRRAVPAVAHPSAREGD